jgi:alkanesulfonate monooxygenase SsuD/methylene tetrahydromethanopterin reductase-like flavin-dependent oxidoreductase (luciferase family)
MHDSSANTRSETMAGLGVGVMHNTINSRFGPKPLIRADYMTGVACGADSFWVADHLNSVLPPSMWTPKYVGAARVIPKMDAHLEPWTMLGYLAGRNKLGRMRLGVAVTDTGRRNPAVTAQAVASLHLLTRGRAVLGIGTGERESNAPYGVDWSKPVARFEEAVATIRALWNSNGDLVTRDSPFFPLHKATFALPPFKGKWPEIWIAAHGPRMMRATGRYADGWFPGTTRATEYGEQLEIVRTAASNAGRDPLAIAPALIRFIVTGRSHGEIDKVELRYRQGVHAQLPRQGLGSPRCRTPARGGLHRSARPHPAIDRRGDSARLRSEGPQIARRRVVCRGNTRRGHRADCGVPRQRIAIPRRGQCRRDSTESAQERVRNSALRQGRAGLEKAVTASRAHD